MCHYYQGHGEHEGELIASSKNATGMQSVHCAHFLDELVKRVPAERAHFNKRLVSIEDKRDNGVVMHFKDGTTEIADGLIGADGIHSTVREYLLGEEDVAAHAIFAGSVAYRRLVPMEKGVEKMGEEFTHNSFMLCRPGI